MFYYRRQSLDRLFRLFFWEGGVISQELATSEFTHTYPDTRHSLPRLAACIYIHVLK